MGKGLPLLKGIGVRGNPEVFSEINLRYAGTRYTSPIEESMSLGVEFKEILPLNKKASSY